jgi:hypothetical protein
MPFFKFAGDADTNDSTADDKEIVFIHMRVALKACSLETDHILYILQELSFILFIFLQDFKTIDYNSRGMPGSNHQVILFYSQYVYPCCRRVL